METWEVIVHIVIPIVAILISIIGAMLVVAVMWGKVNQIITSLLGRVESVERKQDLLSGNTEGAAMTVAQCGMQRGNCSQMICGKLDDLKKSLQQMELRRDGEQKEVQNMKVQIAKIAQCIDDWRANGGSTKRWSNGMSKTREENDKTS